MVLCLAMFTFTYSTAHAETRQAAAGPQYEKSSRYTFWYGKGYRDLWTTPIEVEVLDLAR